MIIIYSKGETNPCFPLDRVWYGSLRTIVRFFLILSMTSGNRSLSPKSSSSHTSYKGEETKFERFSELTCNGASSIGFSSTSSIVSKKPKNPFQRSTLYFLWVLLSSSSSATSASIRISDSSRSLRYRKESVTDWVGLIFSLSDLLMGLINCSK